MDKNCDSRILVEENVEPKIINEEDKNKNDTDNMTNIIDYSWDYYVDIIYLINIVKEIVYFI